MTKDTEITTCLNAARQARQNGHAQIYIDQYTQLLKLSTETDHLVEANGVLGGHAFSAQSYDTAIHHFTNAVSLQPKNDILHFDLGVAYEMTQDFKSAYASFLKAHHANPNNARYHLYAGDMAWQIGAYDAATEIWSLGNDLDAILTHAHLQPNMQPDLAAKSKRADKAIREKLQDIHQESIKAFNTPRVDQAIWIQTDPDRRRPFKNDLQQPHFFYMPDLPAIPVYESLPWFDDFAAATNDIRDEFLAAQDINSTPYVHGNMRDPAWQKLAGSTAWNSVHLYKDGQCTDEIKKRFPKTLAALDHVPMPLIDGNPLEVFFSVLAPNTHIPPHFGLSNCRLTVHLPLILPHDCAIKVADKTYHWNMDHVFAFDDSFMHEAWNNSNETRVVLIIEAWAPDLTPQEQHAINASFTARQNWLLSRQIPNSEI